MAVLVGARRDYRAVSKVDAGPLQVDSAALERGASKGRAKAIGRAGAMGHVKCGGVWGGGRGAVMSLAGRWRPLRRSMSEPAFVASPLRLCRDAAIAWRKAGGGGRLLGQNLRCIAGPRQFSSIRGCAYWAGAASRRRGWYYGLALAPGRAHRGGSIAVREKRKKQSVWAGGRSFAARERGRVFGSRGTGRVCCLSCEPQGQKRPGHFCGHAGGCWRGLASWCSLADGAPGMMHWVLFLFCGVNLTVGAWYKIGHAGLSRGGVLRCFRWSIVLHELGA